MRTIMLGVLATLLDGLGNAEQSIGPAWGWHEFLLLPKDIFFLTLFFLQERAKKKKKERKEKKEIFQIQLLIA